MDTIKKMQFLSDMQLPCYDDGKKFTTTSKLDKIDDILAYTPYNKVSSNLYRLYSKMPLNPFVPGYGIPDELKDVVVISTHADFVRNITKPFVSAEKEDVLRGTFDNSATNAAVLYLMTENLLPDNVLVAFTGNEEHGMRGAKRLAYDLGTNLRPRFIALDVTDLGYKTKKSFSIENAFSLSKSEIDEVIAIAKETGQQGCGMIEALPDEAYAYANNGFKCFSLCVPTKGDMHSDSGCLMRASSYFDYVDMVGHIASNWHSRTRDNNFGGRYI